MLYDLQDAYGRYIATYGQDGTTAFVSNLERQNMQEVETIRRRIASGAYAPAPADVIAEIIRSNDFVATALYDDKIPRLWTSSRDCLKFGRADAGLNDRSKYLMYCVPWADQLDAAKRQREAALAAAGNFSVQAAADAETTASLTEQLRTVEEQGGVALGPLGGLPKPKAGLPSWAKVALGAGATLVAARVLIPPLFGVYLRER